MVVSRIEEKHAEGRYFLNFNNHWIDVGEDALEAQRKRLLRLNQMEHERLSGKSMVSASVGHVVDEEKHPGEKGFQRRHGRGEALLGGGEFFNFAAIYRFDKGVTGGEVAIKRAGANAGLAGDVVEAGGPAIAGEGPLGGSEDALAIALCVGADLASKRRWRELLFLHRRFFFCNRRLPPVILYSETISVLAIGSADVNAARFRAYL